MRHDANGFRAYRPGISNLIADLLMAMVLLGVTAAIMAVISHITIETSSKFGNLSSYNYTCPCVWLITSNISDDKDFLLILANPYNESLSVKVLNLDNASGAIKLVLSSNEMKTLVMPSGNIIVVSDSGCVVTPREVTLP